jgi:hypothetical protein
VGHGVSAGTQLMPPSEVPLHQFWFKTAQTSAGLRTGGAGAGAGTGAGAGVGAGAGAGVGHGVSASTQLLPPSEVSSHQVWFMCRWRVQRYSAKYTQNVWLRYVWVRRSILLL